MPKPSRGTFAATLAAKTTGFEFPNMKDHVYKLIELTGTSTISIEDAITKAIKRAHKTIRKLGWFQVIETRGSIDQGKVQHWQVTIKVGFTLER